MRYVVFTARHHDGFALFDDPGSNFTSEAYAAHHDFVADYVRAIRKAGLGVGLYYSVLDWRFPGFFFPGIYKRSATQMREQYHRQVTELASHYGKLDILWFDGGADEWLGFGGVEFEGKARSQASLKPGNDRFDWEDAETVTGLRKLQPDIIINDRTDAPADFRSREGDHALGQFDNQHPWELCTTITESGSWGYEPDAKVKTLAELIRLLVGVVGRDGNLLLNVGPRPDGRIEPNQAERLKEMGHWLQTNGKSIYGTRGGPFLPGRYGVSTRNSNFIFLHLLESPSGELSLPRIPAKVMRANTIDGSPVRFVQDATGIRLFITLAQKSSIDTIVRLELNEPSDTLSVVSVPEANPQAVTTIQ